MNIAIMSFVDADVFTRIGGCRFYYLQFALKKTFYFFIDDDVDVEFPMVSVMAMMLMDYNPVVLNLLLAVLNTFIFSYEVKKLVLQLIV